MTAISGNLPLDVMYSSSSAVAGNPSIINPVDLYMYVQHTHKFTRRVGVANPCRGVPWVPRTPLFVVLRACVTGLTPHS